MSARGYATIVDPDRPTWERDTITCGHCQQVIFVKPGSGSTVYLVQVALHQWKEEMGAFCRVCMRSVCLTCEQDGRCTPWEKRIEAAEARDRFLRSVGVG